MAAITFPIPQADLGDQLPVQLVNWNLKHFQEISMAGDAEFLAADLAPPLWMGEVTLRPLLTTVARGLMAKLDSLDGSIHPFFLANPMGWYPASDPRGTLYGTSTPVIGTIQSDRKRLSITGLPAGYVLSPGDFFAVPYASGARRGLFRLSSGATANGSGNVAEIEVRPHLQSGISAGASVTFAKPAAKVKIVPDSAYMQMHNANRARISFSVRQTLQAN